MKTLASEACKSEILRRLGDVSLTSSRRWGRMSAPQMICHLIDSARMMIGEKHVSDASGVLQRTVVKWIALYSPVKWPPGILTRPEIDQEIMGTRPGDFTRDVASLAGLVETMAARTNVDHPPHPIFGPMSHAAWLRWAYLHMDHHLRQFGA